MREAWIRGQLATARAIDAPAFGNSRPPFRLVVDLGDDLFSRDWWRGAATLAVLIFWALMLGPGIEPLPAGSSSEPARVVKEQWQAAGIGSQAGGSRSGMRMAARPTVQPIAQAPERAFVVLFATVGSDGLARSLARLGAATGDAVAVESMVRSGGGRVVSGTPVSVVLGRRGHGGLRSVEKVMLRTGLGMRMVVERSVTGLTATRWPIAVDRRPLRIRGRAGDGLYWALRAAGASSQSAASYLKALATQIDVGEVRPEDRFDLVLAHARSSDGLSRAGPLLYAGLERASEPSLQLVAWNLGDRTTWIDAARIGAVPAGEAMSWPVNARITSGFGMRIHPILRFARMHSGIDFGAGWGTPIRAAADGQVTRAGWAGGYGRQVRIAHGDGLVTSYSHMSRMVVEPGSPVRQGQLIGYVGSSGLSTGPHLHYEVLRNGNPVNPLSVRFAGAPVDAAVQDAVRARLKALLGAATRT